MSHRVSTLMLVAAFAMGAQAPPAGQAAENQNNSAEVLNITAPTREKPQTYEGKMTMGENAPVWVGKGQAKHPGVPQNIFQAFALTVPPKTKLKATLVGRTTNFRMMFVSEDMNRTYDPGLQVNKIMGREDAAFYDNRTNEVKHIFCMVMGKEPMTNEPFKLVFTDF